MNMEKITEQLNIINRKQKSLMNEMSKEKLDDIHSVLRSKNLADSIIELEVSKNTLIELIVKSV